MAFSSLGDPSENENKREIRTYHPNDFTNYFLRLVGPSNAGVKSSHGNYAMNRMLPIIRKAICTRDQLT